MSLIKIINKIKFGLLGLCLIPLLGNFSMAECTSSTIFGTVFCKAYEEKRIITIGNNPDKVGPSIIEGEELEIDLSDVSAKRKPSVIVRVIKFLLSITIALSITMIMYNGMVYIIETGRGKDSKDLVKNIIYIVIGILVAMFSVLIVTLMQSIPGTIDKGTSNPVKDYDPAKILDGSYTEIVGLE